MSDLEKALTRIHREEYAAVVASGRSAQVFFDYGAQQPTTIPAAFREQIASYEGIAV